MPPRCNNIHSKRVLFLIPAGMVHKTQRLNIYNMYHTGDTRSGHTSRHHDARKHGPAGVPGASHSVLVITQLLAGTVDIDIVRRFGIIMSAFKPPQYGRDIIHKLSECRLVTLIKQRPMDDTAQGSYHYLESLTSTSSALSALLSHLSSHHGIVYVFFGKVK